MAFLGEHMHSDWILPAELLEETPSRRDGISRELEKEYRNKSTYFIETLAKELKW